MLLPPVNSDARCPIPSPVFTVRGMPPAKKRAPRKPLTPEQKADAKRLKSIWKEAMAGVDKSTQDDFGDAYGVGTQGAVWQYLNGRTPLNILAAGKFARGLGCSIDDFS